MNESITIGELLLSINNLLLAEGASKQATANHLSALRLYLESINCNYDELPVGAELRDKFTPMLNKYLDTLHEQGLSSRTIRDRKSLIRKCRGIFIQLEMERMKYNNEPSPFQSTIQQLMNGLSTHTVARQAGIYPNTLKKLLSGVPPTEKMTPSIRRLERFFGLDDKALISLLPCEMDSKHESEVAEIPFRRNLAIKCNTRYLLRSGFTDAFAGEWSNLMRFKTSVLPPLGMKRSTGSFWTPSSEAMTPKQQKDWYAMYNGKYFPSASIKGGMLARYLGWLDKFSSLAGTLSQEQVQTLRWWANPSVLTEYLQWDIERSDNIVNNGHLLFLRFAMDMCHPETGFLTQTPKFGNQLPYKIEGDWAEYCKQAHQKYKELANTLKPRLQCSRNPFDPIGEVMELERPLSAIKDMLRRMRIDRSSPDSIRNAQKGRNIFLIGLMMCVPLRVKNLRTLTYKKDGTGHIYKENGVWSLRIPAKEFKNRKELKDRKNFVIGLDPVIYKDLEAYLNLYRPLLLKGSQVDYLFVTERSAKANIPMEGMNGLVNRITKRYLMNSPGVGPHAMRHLVATSIIKESGNFTVAALMLNDSEATVRKSYAHLQANDGASAYRKMFSDIFTG